MEARNVRIDESAPLPLFKVLGDDTRYAIHRRLAASTDPLTVAEISEAVGLHPNTVRPHLERMREVGLVEVSVDTSHRRVGRPQHRYSIAPDAPDLGLDTTAMPTLARLVLTLADRLGAADAEVEAVGRDEGRRRRRACSPPVAASPADVLLVDQVRLGFEPDRSTTADGDTVVTFGRCPFGDLAEQHADIVCGLHRGLVEGFVEGFGEGSVDGSAETRLVDFHPLSDRAPCRATLR